MSHFEKLIFTIIYQFNNNNISIYTYCSNFLIEALGEIFGPETLNSLIIALERMYRRLLLMATNSSLQ